MHRVLTPKLHLLSEPVVLKIVDEARDVLEKVGVIVENEEALTLLADAGLPVDRKRKHVKIPGDVVESALRTVPSEIRLYDRDGNETMVLSGENTYFNPGSAALHLWDRTSGRPRKANSRDLFRFVRLVDSLPHFAAQSTGLIPSDVPSDVADRYRLYFALQYGTKPVVTGTFAMDGFEAMYRMLVAVRGSEEALKEKPLAIFDCCPSPPLKWSELTCHDLMMCARTGVPAELVSMPLAGATAPVTLLGALVQLTAENLSGIVIHQLTCPGAPIIFGGSPAIFDMRTGTTPMGAIETMMMDAAYAQIGKYLGLPTHAYMGLSDAKQPDAQAGFETAMGAVLAVLAGVNVISGPGMLDFESCQSLEKLVIDHEICGQALWLKRGIQARSEVFGEDLYGNIYEGDYFLTSPKTLEWFRKEFYFPSDVIDRKNLQDWETDGAKTIWERAATRVEKILAEQNQPPLPEDVATELKKLMRRELQKANVNTIPFEPEEK